MIAIGWVILLGLLAILFDHLLLKQENPNQHVSGIQSNTHNEVVLARNRNHHYVADGKINGQPVTYLVDTGATHVAIPPQVADRLGLEAGYPGTAQTANGTVRTAHTIIASLSLGTIHLTDVQASITYGMTGEKILLGMSALKNVEFTHRNGELTIRQAR